MKGKASHKMGSLPFLAFGKNRIAFSAIAEKDANLNRLRRMGVSQQECKYLIEKAAKTLYPAWF
ncbi:hypothetical protein P421_13025 [Heyndrickxia coagulans P38]|nr:hypothetical protein P421_13025 [Heyndrickxia coagulans P38]